MKRIQSLDIARGFTVLMIAPIHTVMMYSKPAVQHSALGVVSAFIAEGPGAQLFMLVMGISVNFSSRINRRSVFQRAFYLLLAAYTLNGLKFIVPFLFGWMPQNLLSELHLTGQHSSLVFFFFLGDILHFAAIAYLLLYVVYRLKNFRFWSLVFAGMIIFISPAVWDLNTGLTVMDYILQLAGGHPPDVFFPVFPWLVYPLVGLSLGYYLKNHDTTLVLKRAGWSGIILILISLLFPYTKLQGDWLPFYRTEPADTIFHLGFVLIWIAVIQWVSQKVRFNKVFLFLIFCSRNITAIYLVQWILICWGMGWAGYQALGFTATFLYMIGITIITLLIARLYGRDNI